MRECQKRSRSGAAATSCARSRLTRQLALTLVAVFLLPANASAGKALDYLRNYDLNNYALGVALSTRQSPYVGTENGTIAYPYLTSFKDPTLTKDWLLLRDGALGIRWITENDWELGLIGRIQTLGFGSSDSPMLAGIADAEWTLELGPTVGWRRWPVQFNVSMYTEISGRHDGQTSDFSISIPFEWSRGYLVPVLELNYQDSDYLNYYYGVSAEEALVNRPEYVPGGGVNPELYARWGFALNSRWLLSGNVGVEYLNDEITNSPIVNRDHVWSARIGLAYNANVFQPRHYADSMDKSPRFDFRVGAFYDMIDSKIVRDTGDGVPGFEADIESFLGAAEEDWVLQLDSRYRIGQYHRLEAGYFAFGRTSSTILEEDFQFGDEIFAAGTEIHSEFDASVFQVSYTYLLMRDSQKELGLNAGLHFTKFNAQVTSQESAQRQNSKIATPLPVIGLVASVALGQKTSASAKLQFFRMDFDRYSGALTYFTLDVQRQFSDNFRVGVGYNYYRTNISSSHDDVNGSLELRHHGPVLFMTAQL